LNSDSGSRSGEGVGVSAGVPADDEEEFWSGMVALEFGDIPALHEEVAVVGYPQGETL